MRKVMLGAVLAVGCGLGPAGAADVVLGLPGWGSANAASAILKRVIEDNFGLEVALKGATTPEIFEGMHSGDIDVHPEVWIPGQQALYDRYVEQEQTVVFNQSPANSGQGLCVPDYVRDEMGITAISDLADATKAAVFGRDGHGKPELWIGDPEWSPSGERVRAKSYGYDQNFDLKEMPDSEASAQIATAVAEKKAWVGYCYTTSASMVAYKLVMLNEPRHDPATWNLVSPDEDPDWLSKSTASTAWEASQLHLAYSAALRDKAPEVVALLESYALPEEVLAEAEYEVSVNKMTIDDFAKKWVEDNADIVSGWLTQ